MQFDTGPIEPGGRIAAFADAIARAEGFYTPGTIPAKAHNPGDLVLSWLDNPTMGAEKITVFASDAEGWRALYRQLDLIATGRSKVYTLNDTIRTMGQKWAPNDPANNWALNVAVSLGVSVDTALRSLLVTT